MKPIKTLLVPALVTAALLTLPACNRQTRGNADAQGHSRAQSPAEGGSTTTAGDAGQSKNFGDTRAKARSDGVSPSSSPTGQSKDASANQPPAPVTPPTPPATPQR